MTDDQFGRIKKGLNFHSEGGVYNLCTLTETTLRTIIEDAVKFYEKQQKIDALHIMELQKQNGELTDKVRMLELQIEKMKCCANCRFGYCERSSECIDKDGNRTFHCWNEEKEKYCDVGKNGKYQCWEIKEK